MRGDIYQLRAPPNTKGHEHTKGHEQAGGRFAVAIQSDDLILSALLVAPTSRSVQSRSFRPTILIGEEPIRVLIEQTTAVAPERLGKLVGRVSRSELDDINNALRLVLELD